MSVLIIHLSDTFGKKLGLLQISQLRASRFRGNDILDVLFKSLFLAFLGLQ